jgi:hypothetical protein
MTHCMNQSGGPARERRDPANTFNTLYPPAPGFKLAHRLFSPMKPISRLRLASVAVGAFALSAAAQTAAPTPAPTATTQSTTSPATPAPTTVAVSSAFESAPASVTVPVANAQALAGTIRAGLGVSTTEPALARAVSQATTAIVQDGRAVRANLLAERQAALARLRAAQTQPERERLIGELRSAAGQRMDEQREVARLVRDRLRELRDTTSLTRP